MREVHRELALPHQAEQPVVVLDTTGGMSVRDSSTSGAQRCRSRTSRAARIRRRVAAFQSAGLESGGWIAHGLEDLGDHELGEAVEDGLLVVDVVVERHRLHAQRLAEAAHGHGVEPLLVGELERAAQDALTAQRLAGGDVHAHILRR